MEPEPQRTLRPKRLRLLSLTKEGQLFRLYLQLRAIWNFIIDLNGSNRSIPEAEALCMDSVCNDNIVRVQSS